MTGSSVEYCGRCDRNVVRSGKTQCGPCDWWEFAEESPYRILRSATAVARSDEHADSMRELE